MTKTATTWRAYLGWVSVLVALLFFGVIDLKRLYDTHASSLTSSCVFNGADIGAIDARCGAVWLSDGLGGGKLVFGIGPPNGENAYIDFQPGGAGAILGIHVNGKSFLFRGDGYFYAPAGIGLFDGATLTPGETHACGVFGGCELSFQGGVLTNHWSTPAPKSPVGGR